jgi:SAM-dependent methyltransferase
VHPPVSRDDQALIYNDRYFSKEGDWVCGIFRAGYTEAESQLKEEAREILDMLPFSSGRLMDIGCAGGVFLSEARSRGFEVVGLELNASMAAYARSTYQLQVLNSRIEDVGPDQWSDHFDVVTLLDCLEHVPQPLVAVKKVARWLRPGGYVFIRGPLSNSPLVRIKEGLRRVLRVAKRLPGYPLDANTFNKRSLETLLELSGFQRPLWIGETRGFANLLAQRNV